MAQTNGGPKPTPQVQEPITYQTAVAVWTEAQPHFWPHLRMTVDDLVTAYIRDGQGEIVKLGEGDYRAAMGGCIIIVTIGDAL